MDFKEIGINVGNWADSAQDRDYWKALVNAALNYAGIQTACLFLLVSVQFVTLSNTTPRLVTKFYFVVTLSGVTLCGNG